MFLTDEELIILTGRKLRSAQIKVLRREGIPFTLTAGGKPVVVCAALLNVPTKRPRRAPNLEAMR